MKQLLFLLMLAVSLVSTTQAQTWQWGRRGGGGAGSNNQAEKIIDMQTDKNGNVYLLAQLDGGGDENIDTGNGDTLDLGIKTNGYRCGALISYDCSGKLRWSKVFGSDVGNRARAMTMDTLGHIYVAMNTYTNFRIDTDSIAANPNDKYIGLIQYDTAGHFKWFRMPSPDTVDFAKNLTEYNVFNMATTPNGDSYLFCILGTGLISGSTNLVATTPGYYMLKYNVAGMPKELIKLDMTKQPKQEGGFSYSSFNVTRSRKFIFTGVRISGTSSQYPVYVAGQELKHKIFLCCFSPTGNVLWRVENKVDTTGSGLQGRPYIDNNKGLIYTAGFIDGQQTDTINGIPIKNALGSAAIPLVYCLDTLGNNKWLKKGDGYWIPSLLRDLTFRSDGRLFASGFGGGVIWDGFNFYGGNNGYQIFMPSFDAATGNVLSMDSLKSTNGASYADVIAADNNNNIYLGGQMVNDVVVAGQTLQTYGGTTDFFIAKFGSNNCGLVPLRFISYSLQQAQGVKVENIWTTASEVNVSRFNIQRSTNGKDWETVGVVMAKNKGLNEYRFVDVIGNSASGIGNLYYRIESLDYDGQKQYSEVRQLAIRNEQLAISIYPNPARSFINLNVETLVGAGSIVVTDLYGKQLKTQSLSMGTNTIDVSKLTKGMYFVSMITSEGKTTKKLIVE